MLVEPLVDEEKSTAPGARGSLVCIGKDKSDQIRLPSGTESFKHLTFPRSILWEKDRELEVEQAVRELVRCRLQSSGPTTLGELCRLLNLAQGRP